MVDDIILSGGGYCDKSSRVLFLEDINYVHVWYEEVGVWIVH